MNTILADRLFSDPRLRLLADRLRCPLRALGLLGAIWHGTQNMGVVYANSAAILASLPAGLRRDKRYIDALVASGWLVPRGEMFEVVGNKDHVQAREVFSESGKKGAEARWGKKDGLAMPEANGNSPEEKNGLPPLPPDPPLPPMGVGDLAGAREQTHPPGSLSLRDVTAEQVSVERGHALCEVYRTAQREEHGSEQPLVPPPKRVWEARLVIAMAGGDDALAAAIVRAFVGSPGHRGYWSDRKHAFHLLTDARDFEHAQQLAAGGRNASDDEDPIEAGLRRTGAKP